MPPAMKIGFNARCLAEPEMRGLSRYAANLLRSLSDNDDLELVLFSREEPWQGHLSGIRARLVVFKSSRETLWNDFLLPEMIRKEGIDLFHAPADRGLPFRKPCPFIVTVHDSYERTYWRELFPTTRSRLWYWKNEFVNYRLADIVLTVSETTRADFVRLGVAPEHKIRVIPLAPAENFTPVPAAADETILSRHKVERPYILYVGGYDSRKNVSSLVQAFERASLPRHSLVIVAKHIWNYPVLVRHWEKLSCFDRIKCLEVDHSDVPAFYRCADFFVNPSLWESFSFQVVESMACGTPLLASDRKAIPETAGSAAEYIDPENIDALARAIERIAGDSSLKAELRTRGLQRVKSFSWRKTAEDTLQAYKELIGKDKS